MRVKGLSGPMTGGQRNVPSYHDSTQLVLQQDLPAHAQGQTKYGAGKAQKVERRGVKLNGLVAEWARV